jgi:hypothetical protein
MPMPHIRRITHIHGFIQWNLCGMASPYLKGSLILNLFIFFFLQCLFIRDLSPQTNNKIDMKTIKLRNKLFTNKNKVPIVPNSLNVGNETYIITIIVNAKIGIKYKNLKFILFFFFYKSYILKLTIVDVIYEFF